MISLTSPTQTWAHDWPAGAKLAGLCLATAGLFLLHNLAALLAALAVVLALYALPGRVFFIAGMKRLRILWPFVVIVLAWHGWTGAYDTGVAIVLRMVTAVGLANLVTSTTRLSEMIDAVHILTKPLRWLGVTAPVLEVAIALVIRMTPVLIQKGGMLTQAWRARSRRAPNWRIILPFTVMALDDADHVAEALRARGGLIRKETP